jgi:hypothetical protein
VVSCGPWSATRWPNRRSRPRYGREAVCEGDAEIAEESATFADVFRTEGRAKAQAEPRLRGWSSRVVDERPDPGTVSWTGKQYAFDAK